MLPSLATRRGGKDPSKTRYSFFAVTGKSNRYGRHLGIAENAVGGTHHGVIAEEHDPGVSAVQARKRLGARQTGDVLRPWRHQLGEDRLVAVASETTSNNR